MVRIGEQRNFVGLFFLTAGFELFLHLRYAHDKRLPFQFILSQKLKGSFLVFLCTTKTRVDCRLF